MTRLESYLTEAKVKNEKYWNEYSWEEVFREHGEEFLKWLKNKSTTFFHGQWKVDTKLSHTTVYETEDENGNVFKLKIEKDSIQHKTGNTRNPEKTRRYIKAKLSGDNFLGYIDIIDKVTIGEDPKKLDKWNKQVEKTKEFLKVTFGVEW